MVFVRGVEQAEFVSRLRGVGGDRVLLVPVDVGKRSAMSMVANQHGEVIVDPFEFALDRTGVDLLLGRVAGAEETTEALVVRFGIEAAGHYHRTLTETLRGEAVELVELHPGAVHKARSEMGQRRLKSDIRDLAAMVELMARGTGRSSRVGGQSAGSASSVVGASSPQGQGSGHYGNADSEPTRFGVPRVG